MVGRFFLKTIFRWVGMNMIVEKGGAVFFGCWKSCFGGNLKSTPTVEQ